MTKLAATTLVYMATAIAASCASRPGKFVGPTSPDNGLNAACVTIDATEDDEALAFVRNLALKPKPMTHRSTKETGANLERCTAGSRMPASPVTIVGHGTAGAIITGGGASLDDDEKWVGWPSESQAIWHNELAGLGAKNAGGIITLLSCDTALGQGKDLMADIVKQFGRPVRARNGMVFTSEDGVSFERGSRWVYEPPDSEPRGSRNLRDDRTVIPSERPLRASGKTAFANLRFDPGTISRIEVRRAVGHGFGPWRAVPAAAVARLVTLIEFDNVVRQGVPLAVRTGQIRFTHNSALEIGPHEFDIWNDRLLQDASDSRSYYYTSVGFSDLLLSFE